MPSTNIPRSYKVGAVTLTDTVGTTYEITLQLDDGNVTVGLNPNVVHVADRGKLGVLIPGDDQPVSFTFSAVAKEWTASGAALPEYVMCTASGASFTIATLNSGDYNGKSCDLIAVSAQCKVFQMRLAIADPAGGTSETLYLLNCEASLDFAEGMPNKFTISGRSWQTHANFMANIGS